MGSDMRSWLQPTLTSPVTHYSLLITTTPPRLTATAHISCYALLVTPHSAPTETHRYRPPFRLRITRYSSQRPHRDSPLLPTIPVTHYSLRVTRHSNPPRLTANARNSGYELLVTHHNAPTETHRHRPPFRLRVTRYSSQISASPPKGSSRAHTQTHRRRHRLVRP